MKSRSGKGETRSKKTNVDSPALVDKQIAEIRARLGTMRELFPGEPSAGEYGPRWSDDELARFEAVHGVTLPAAYRAFLREIGDGGANFLWNGKSWERGMVSLRDARPEDLALLANSYPLTSAKKDLPGGKLDGLFMIGIGDPESMGGEYLVVTGKAAGAIWTDNRGVDTGKFEPLGPFLKVHLDWLDQRIAEERERRAPPDPTALAKLPPAEQIRALCTAKNTALVGSPPYDLAGLLDLFMQVSPDGRYWENLFDVASAILEHQRAAPGVAPAACAFAIELLRTAAHPDFQARAKPKIYKDLAQGVGLIELLYGFLGDWDGLVRIARESRGQALSERADEVEIDTMHAAHMLIAACALEKDAALESVSFPQNPKYELRPHRFHLCDLVSRQDPRVQRQFFERLPAEIALFFLLGVFLYDKREFARERKQSFDNLRRIFSEPLEALLGFLRRIREDLEGPPERAAHYPSSKNWRRIEDLESTNGLVAVIRSIENDDALGLLELTDESRKSAALPCVELARIERVVGRPAAGNRQLKRLAERARELGSSID